MKQLFGTPSVLKVLSKFSRLEQDLKGVLEFHSEQTDFHKTQAEIQQRLKTQAGNALSAIQNLLGNY